LQPYDVPGNSHELEQQSNEQHVEEPERPVTPQPEEEPKGPEVIEPEPEPSEKELSYPPQSEDHESENDERLKIEVQPIEVDEPSASTHEETEQMEEDQQLASQDDEASEIEAILTPEPPEGSAEGEAREQSTEHDESPGHEHETPDREQEVTSSTQDAETPHAEQEHETPMDVDAEGRDVSVDAEASLPGTFNTVTPTSRVPGLSNQIH
jgi:bromodomain-containing protein 8